MDKRQLAIIQGMLTPTCAGVSVVSHVSWGMSSSLAYRSPRVLHFELYSFRLYMNLTDCRGML